MLVERLVPSLSKALGFGGAALGLTIAWQDRRDPSSGS
jgi:hypothetical protein